MPLISTTVESPTLDSFRVQQIAGMFDLPLTGKVGESFAAEFPGLEEDWMIGAVVGPSGSGKTTLARQAFGDAVWRPGAWPADRAVIDGFGDLPIKEITHVLTAVGLSSPPTWLKPYRVLSGGEKFRCDLAAALLPRSQAPPGNERRARPCLSDQPPEQAPSGETAEEAEPQVQRVPRQSQGTRKADCELRIAESSPSHPQFPLVVFDEFTSVVDRTVARIASAAVARAIRSGRICKRFVAVTCHYDVLEWLEADWYVDLVDGRLHRRRLRRPTIRLSVAPCDRGQWRLFARHHYLNGGLPAASTCYVARWDAAAIASMNDMSPSERPSVLPPAGPTPAAFCAVSPLLGAVDVRRISRVVVLPDYQGVGIGARLLNTVAAHHTSLGHTVRITTSHPAMLAHLQRSPQWRAKHVYPNTRRRRGRTLAGRRIPDAAGRCVATFEFYNVGHSLRE